MGSKVQADKVSDGNEKLIENQSKDYICYTLVKKKKKNLAALCLCPRNLWKVELESDNLEYLVEEITKHQSLQAVTWLLLTTYAQIREQRNDKIAIYIFYRKQSIKV